MRPRLGYAHRASDACAVPAVCQVPELPLGHPLDVGVDHDTCSGCLAYALALALHCPEVVGRSRDGEPVRYVDSLREHHDPLDPMMVVFERELAKRGGSV